jgi:hypothetical protein
MTPLERANAIIQDILTSHLPRIKESLERGYIDENQILRMYDHAVRARLLTEIANYPNKEVGDALAKLVPNDKIEHEDALDRVTRALETYDAQKIIKDTVKQVTGNPAAPVPCAYIIVGRGMASGIVTYASHVEGLTRGTILHGKERENAVELDLDTATTVCACLNRWYPDINFRTLYANPEVAPATEPAPAPAPAPLTHSAKGLAGVYANIRQDALSKVEADLEAAPASMLPVNAPAPEKQEAKPKVYEFMLDSDRVQFNQPKIKGSYLRLMLSESKQDYTVFQEAPLGKDPDIQIKDEDLVEVAGQIFYSVPAAVFGAKADPVKMTLVNEPSPLTPRGIFKQVPALEADLRCACGGSIKELPAAPEPIFKCERCERVYMDEQDVASTRKNATIVPQKCPEAVFWTTGTLLNGTTSVPLETQISLNGSKAIVRTVNGKFTLSYERIVRMTISQQRGHLNDFTGTDADLPRLSCTYYHRVAFDKLPGERSGSLCRGESVEATPGMAITCVDTSNA